MMFFSKKAENIEYFKLHYDDEALHGAYKYFSTISVGESDAQKLKSDSLEEKIFMDLKYNIDGKLHLLLLE